MRAKGEGALPLRTRSLAKAACQLDKGNSPLLSLRDMEVRSPKPESPTNNPVSIALMLAASTLRLSKTYLGAQFRRFRSRLGAPVAIKAMAAKLARLVYRMLRYGMKYVDQGAAFYELQQ
jgi:hypothetical protein